MEFDADIDDELNALSDISLEEANSCDEEVDIAENVPQVDCGKFFPLSYLKLDCWKEVSQTIFEFYIINLGLEKNYWTKIHGLRNYAESKALEGKLSSYPKPIN